MSIGRSSHVKPSIFRSVGHRHLKRCSSDRQTHQVAIPEAGQANIAKRSGLHVAQEDGAKARQLICLPKASSRRQL